MTQVDILLGGLPKTYDIVVDNTHRYDIVLDKKYHNYDVYIYNLTDRQGIYGDELDPLIFRLTESMAECFIDISMFSDEEYNKLSLENNDVEVNKQIYATLKEQLIKLQSSVDMALTKTADIEPNSLRLLISGDVTNESVANPEKLSAQLTTQVVSNMSKTVELLLNASGVHWFDGYLYEYDDKLLSEMDLTYPKMSLITSCGKMYMKFSFDVKKGLTRLNSNIADFTGYINLKDAIRNNLCLSADTVFGYEILCSCNPISYNLSGTEIALNIVSNITPEGITYFLTDWITQDVRTQSAIGVSGIHKLETSITDEMEAYYGLGRYDNRYLYQWDDYTIYDMGAEIVNRTQSGSVDV